MKQHMYRGSHLPVLMKCVQITKGPIVELGMGMYSTCYLHWACYPTKRRLVSYENSPRWFEFAKLAEADFHQVICTEDFAGLVLNDPWSVAFVDHDHPTVPRRDSVKKLVHAEYVVCHDTENRNERKYKWSEIWPLFKYRWKWGDAHPHTSVFSNVHDLSNFTVTG